MLLELRLGLRLELRLELGLELRLGEMTRKRGEKR